LGLAVQELISRAWQPLMFPSGKFPEEAYRLFLEPTETLSTLTLAYPHLDPTLQDAVKVYVRGMSKPGGPLDGPVGERSYPLEDGATRSSYDVPAEKLLKVQTDILRHPVARLYPVWSWAHVSGDWEKVEKDWPRMVRYLVQRPNAMEEDSRNGYIAGLIAYCRLAARMADKTAVEAGQAVARQAMRDRLEFELAHPRGGFISQVPRLRSIFSRWRFLTPEVGRLLSVHARSVHEGGMRQYVEYHRPTWWLAWNVETMMRNECPYEFPTVAMEIFSARSLILNESPATLALFIDRPWCRADEYYIQKLALTIRAATPTTWTDLRSASGG
jgi:hypothetical protein